MGGFSVGVLAHRVAGHRMHVRGCFAGRRACAQVLACSIGMRMGGSAGAWAVACVGGVPSSPGGMTVPIRHFGCVKLLGNASVVWDRPVPVIVHM